MSAVFDIVLPVFGLIGLGYGLARVGVLGDRTRDGLSDFVFVVAIPALLFRTMAQAQLPPGLPWDYWLCYFGGVLVVWLAAMVTARVFRRSDPEAAIAGMAAGYSNVIFVGLPLVIRAYGEPAMVPAAFLIALHLPLLMPILTVQVERALARSGGAGSWLRMLRGVATNPVFLGIITGLAARLVGFAPSGTLKVMLDSVASTAVPAALVATGLALAAVRLTGELRMAVVLSILKLLGLPGLVWLFARHVFALDPLFTGTAVLIAAAPSGVTAFMFAQRYGIAVPIVSTTLALSTLLAVLTTSFWLIVLGIG